MNLENLGMRVWHHELGEKDCVLGIMKYLSRQESPKWILGIAWVNAIIPVSGHTLPPPRIAHSVSLVAVSLYGPRRHSPTKENGGGSENPIFLPQGPPSPPLISLNRCFQVLLCSFLSSVGCQIEYMYIHQETKIVHGKFWQSKSCNCDKDECDRQNA